MEKAGEKIMRLFRKTIELDEKGMNEFITSVSEDNAPRYKKREELRSNTESGSYWDTLAAEREQGAKEKVSDGIDVNDIDPDVYIDTLTGDDEPDYAKSTEDAEIEAAISLLDSRKGVSRQPDRSEEEQRRALSAEFRNAFMMSRSENDGKEKGSEKEEKQEKEEIPEFKGSETEADTYAANEALFERELQKEKEAAAKAKASEGEKKDKALKTEKKPVKERREGLFTRRRDKTAIAEEKLLSGGKMSARALRDLVVAKCDSIQDCRLQLNIDRTSYQEVTAYLQDTQLIERLDINEKAELSEAGRHILAIKKEMERTSRKRRKLTDYQISILERYEESIPTDIKKIEEDEEYHALIKEDLQKLEGEKGEIIYDRDNAEEKRGFLKKLGMISAIVITALLVLYLALFLVTEREINIMPEFIVTVACAIILVTYIFVENRRAVYTIKMSDKKMNRLITLQNKIKIKYINSTNTIDFLYDKYAINSSGELKYRWEQYVVMRDEMNLQKKNIEILDMYEREIENYMKQLGVHDPEVWTYQASALVDPREMVELKHRLNSRRGKLRESIDFNQGLIDESMAKLRELIEEFPEKEDVIKAVVSDYEIAL